MARVFEFQANQTGYQNSNPSKAEIPQTNLTGIFSGEYQRDVFARENVS